MTTPATEPTIGPEIHASLLADEPMVEDCEEDGGGPVVVVDVPPEADAKADGLEIW